MEQAVTAHFFNLLNEVRRRSLRMAGVVEDMLHEACEVVFEPHEALSRRVVRRDREVDSEEVEIEAEVIRLLSLYQPVGSDLRLLCAMLKVNNDLERIADCAVNLAERAKHLELQPIAARMEPLRHMCPLVQRVLHNAIHAYGMEDAQLARQVLEADPEIDEAYVAIVRRVVQEADSASMAGYLDVLSVAKNLERIADHATNIAEDVIFLCTGSIIRHQGPPPQRDTASDTAES